MVREKQTISKKENQTIKINVGNRVTYPDGTYNIKATFEENNYYDENKDVVIKNGEIFDTTETIIKISKNGIDWTSPQTLNGKYYDNTKIYFRLEDKKTGEVYKDDYTLTLKYNENIIGTNETVYYTKKTLTVSENGKNTPYQTYIINGLPMLNVGDYSIKANFTPKENIRMMGSNIEFTFKQSTNTLAFYSLDNQSLAYNDEFNENIESYIDTPDLIQCQIRTVDGDNPIPNNLNVSLIENNRIVTTTKTFTDMSVNNQIRPSNGCVKFDTNFKSGNSNTMSIMNTYPKLDDNKEYIFGMVKNNYTIEFGTFGKIVIKPTEQIIYIGEGILYKQNYSIPSTHELYITRHNNVYRVMVNNQIIFSISKTFIDTTIKLSELPQYANSFDLITGENVYNTQYNISVDSINFTNSSDITINYIKKELKESVSTYKVDGKHNDKVVTYFSKITWNNDGNKVGYMINNIPYVNDNFLIKNYYTNINQPISAKMYNIKKNYCMNYIEFNRTVYPLDWNITTDNVEQSSPDINLLLTKNNVEINDTIFPTEKFKINCNSSIRNKPLTVYYKRKDITATNYPPTWSNYKTGSTGENGKYQSEELSLTNGDYLFLVKSSFINNDGESEEITSNEVGFRVFNPTTTMTLSANQSSYVVNQTIRLTANLKREGNNVTDGEFGKQTIKFYVGNNQIGTAQTTNGVAIFDYDLNNFILNGYEIGNVTFRAIFNGGNNLNGSSVSTNITINKINITPIVSFTNGTLNGNVFTANYNYADTSKNTLDVEVSNLNELQSGMIQIDNTDVKIFDNVTNISYTLPSYTDLIERTVKIIVNKSNYIEGKTLTYTIKYNNVITKTSLNATKMNPKWGDSNVLTATVKNTDGMTLSGRTVIFKQGTSTLGSSKTNNNGVATLTIDMPSNINTYEYTAISKVENNYKESSASINLTTSKRNITVSLVQPFPLVVSDTVGDIDITNDIWFYGWNRKYRVVDELGERVSGLSAKINVSYDGNSGTDYTRTTDSNGEISRSINITFDSNADLHTLYTKATVYGNNLYNNGSTSYQPFKYKYNEAIFAHPVNPTQNGTGKQWYNLTSDALKFRNNMQTGYAQCGWCSTNEIANSNGNVANKTPKPIICNASNGNVLNGLKTSSFIFDSEIMSQTIYSYDRNYPCTGDKYPVIGTSKITLTGSGGFNKVLNGGMVTDPNKLSTFEYNTIVKPNLTQHEWLNLTQFKMEYGANTQPSNSGVFLVGGLFALIEYRPKEYYL